MDPPRPIPKVLTWHILNTGSGELGIGGGGGSIMAHHLGVHAETSKLLRLACQ